MKSIFKLVVLAGSILLLLVLVGFVITTATGIWDKVSSLAGELWDYCRTGFNAVKGWAESETAPETTVTAMISFLKF